MLFFIHFSPSYCRWARVKESKIGSVVPCVLATRSKFVFNLQLENSVAQRLLAMSCGSAKSKHAHFVWSEKDLFEKHKYFKAI